MLPQYLAEWHFTHIFKLSSDVDSYHRLCRPSALLRPLSSSAIFLQHARPAACMKRKGSWDGTVCIGNVQVIFELHENINCGNLIGLESIHDRSATISIPVIDIRADLRKQAS